jgi:hypothetical protein
MNKIIEGGVYRHFKTKKYCRALGIAKHSETLEDFVLYEELYEGGLAKFWVRPVSMFLEEVEREGKKVPRFLFVGFEIPKA